MKAKRENKLRLYLLHSLWNDGASDYSSIVSMAVSAFYDYVSERWELVKGEMKREFNRYGIDKLNSVLWTIHFKEGTSPDVFLVEFVLDVEISLQIYGKTVRQTIEVLYGLGPSDELDPTVYKILEIKPHFEKYYKECGLAHAIVVLAIAKYISQIDANDVYEIFLKKLK